MTHRPILRPLYCLLTALTLGSAALTAAAQAPESFVGRPIYSEPGAGLQMPPGCVTESPWRSRVGSGDLEVWIVQCGAVVRTWLVRRSVLELRPNNQARLRFQILDERAWPGETAGESASVQCVGRSGQQGGYVVLGARWKPAAGGVELRLASAEAVIRADPAQHTFVAATLSQVDCVRYPEREAQLRRLQQAPR